MIIDKKQSIIELTFVAFDIETTGLMSVVNKIVEIGAVKFRSGKVVETFQELIDPQRQIPPDATSVNGITDDMVKGKPTIEDVLPQFIDFIGYAVPIAHNAPFDVSFLSYDISRLNLKVANKPILDTCVIPKKIFPHLSSYSLENLANYLHIKSAGFHRAMEDAEVCMEIFLQCINEMGNHDQLALQDVLDVNGPSLCFDPGEIVLDEALLPLKEAMETGNLIEIVYQDARGTITTRQVTPLSLGHGRSTAILEAFCHVRQDKRNFRIDRILEIR